MTEYNSNVIDWDFLRVELNVYTRKAFHMLPKLDKPYILDIGCGSGVPTMELARLMDGRITGADIDRPALDKLNRKIRTAGLGHRVETVECSSLQLNFPVETFDIIWCEGAIFPIGFKRALKEWGLLLKPGGFMVLHDDIENYQKKLKQVSKCGFTLLDQFQLNHEVWWNEYYAPVEQYIVEMKKKHAGTPALLKALADKQKEVEMVKRKLPDVGSIYFIMQKAAPSSIQ